MFPGWHRWYLPHNSRCPTVLFWDKPTILGCVSQQIVDHLHLGTRSKKAPVCSEELCVSRNSHGTIPSKSHCTFQCTYYHGYPLVNCHITMENHHVQWVNQRTKHGFNSKLLVYQRVIVRNPWIPLWSYSKPKDHIMLYIPVKYPLKYPMKTNDHQFFFKKKKNIIVPTLSQRISIFLPILGMIDHSKKKNDIN